MDQDRPDAGAFRHRVGDVAEAGGAQRIGGDARDARRRPGRPAASAAFRVGMVSGSTATTRALAFGRGGDPGHQPAAAGRDHHRVQLAAGLLQQFQRPASPGPAQTSGWSYGWQNSAPTSAACLIASS